MKVVPILGIFICMYLPQHHVDCEHLYLHLLQNLYRTFENIIIKMDWFKIMNYRRDLARYRAYKCLLHNFTGRMDNMWMGTGADDPTERRKRLLNRMIGVEGNEYYTKLPRLHQCRNEGFALKRLRYSLKYQHLRNWNCGEDARQHAKSIAALIPELNLTLAHQLFNDWDGDVTTPLLPINRTTRPWLYGLHKLKRNVTASTPQKYPRRALTIHLLWRYTGVFAVNKPRRYSSFTNPPGFIDKRPFITIWRNQTIWDNSLNGTRRIPATVRIYGRHINTTGIHRRMLYKNIPQVKKPFYHIEKSTPILLESGNEK